MRRTAVVVAVLAVVAGIVAVLVQSPAIRIEAVSVAVPTGPADGTPIDLDAQLYVPEVTPAPALLLAHGFGSDRTALDEEARRFAADGYVVLTWSARGFGASEGTIGLNDPEREVADVSVLIDALALRPEVITEDGDPVIGIAGGSYGGGLALLAAAQEPRLDAVVAAAAWHRLSTALSPNAADRTPGVWKEQWASTLFAAASIGAGGAEALREGGSPPVTGPTDPVGDPTASDLVAAACGRFEPALCAAYARTATSGVLAASDADLLDRSSLEGRLGDITAPTLLLSGQDDTLFGLDQAQRNAAGITAALAVRWVAGEHGEASRIDREDARRWLDVHLRGASDDLAAFSWVDPVAGAAQPRDVLPVDTPPGDLGSVDLVLSLDPAGLLTPDPVAGGAADAGTVQVVRPPGGLPASLSTLPGLGDLGGLSGLLPALDLPGQSASFTSDPLDGDVTLLGAGELTLTVDAQQGDPLVFVKLYDVSPGGQARLLQSAVNPTRLARTPATVTLTLSPVAHRLAAGNRLRLTVTTTDQAFADGVDPAVLVLDTSDARLVLPTVDGALVSPLPAAVRIALPVLLVLALSLAALALTRRHEQRLREEPVDEGDPIVIRGLVKRYADGKVSVDGLDLTVGRGQVFGLLGPNGAGKTTTMRMLLGLIHPTAGEIRLLGHPLRPGHPVLDRVGVLVEGPGFAPYLSGRQNLRSHWDAGGRPWDEADVDRALAVADLGPALDRPARTYSHGMRQRLAIAQALLGDPAVLVLDEPTVTGLLAAGAVDVEGSGLAVRLDDTPPEALVAALVEAGISVMAATPRGRLEDAFLELPGVASDARRVGPPVPSLSRVPCQGHHSVLVRSDDLSTHVTDHGYRDAIATRCLHRPLPQIREDLVPPNFKCPLVRLTRYFAHP